LTDRDRARRERDGKTKRWPQVIRVSVFIFIVLVPKLIVDDCLQLPGQAKLVLWDHPGTRLETCHQGTRSRSRSRSRSRPGLISRAAIFMPGTKKLSNLLGQAVSVVVCIAKQVSLSTASSCVSCFGAPLLIDASECEILSQLRGGWQT